VTVRSVRVAALVITTAGAVVTACRGREETPHSTRGIAKSQPGQASSASSTLLAQGDSAYFAAAYDSARHSYEMAAKEGGAHGDSASVARAFTSLGLVAWKQGRFDDAKSIGERASPSSNGWLCGQILPSRTTRLASSLKSAANWMTPSATSSPPARPLRRYMTRATLQRRAAISGWSIKISATSIERAPS